MSVIIKTKEEIEILREGGRRLAKIMQEVVKKVKPGISTQELNDYALKLIREAGDKPAFLNYKASPRDKPYPASLCTSINDEIVHCIPKKNRILKEGDIISLDLGLNHKGLFTDHAVTVPVGKISIKDQKLIDDTKKALEIGIWAARGGGTVGDIGYEIESFVNNRYGIVRELAGHGVGKKVHEDPYVPNYGEKGQGQKLIPGMVIAIEPMLNHGGDDIEAPDNYTIRTADKTRSAHFEHTILITPGEAEVLTKI
ncbi:MAG: type I methionyl aminopeptidase [Candidatus Pacebacteria bacterium]|jgi:methionyl aminopeptidase|nr:type I methionyl aminopeptidase [Candidatus Paceibacterota bacterium]